MGVTQSKEQEVISECNNDDMYGRRGRFLERAGEYQNKWGFEYSEDSGAASTSFNLFGKNRLNQFILEQFCNGSSGDLLDHVSSYEKKGYAEREMQNNPVLREGWKIAQERRPHADSIGKAIYLYSINDKYEVVTNTGFVKMVKFYQEFNRETSQHIDDPANYHYKYILLLLMAAKRSQNFMFSPHGCPSHLYRGCNFPTKLQVGLFFSFQHITSTTTDLEVATTFNHNCRAPAVFTILNRSSRNSLSIAEFSEYPGEEEYLLFQDAKFQVKSIFDLNGIKHIQLEFVYDDSYNN